jgi:hypothetical protein
MATSSIKRLKRTYKIDSTSWANGTLTVTTIIPHFLVANDEVTLLFNNVPQNLKGIVSNTGTAGTSKTFTIPCPYDYRIANDGEVIVDYFTGAMLATTANGVGLGAGVLGILSMPTSDSAQRAIQFSTTAGTTAGSISVTGSLDGAYYSQSFAAVSSPMEFALSINIPNNTTYIAYNVSKTPFYRITCSVNVTGALATGGRLYITFA